MLPPLADMLPVSSLVVVLASITRATSCVTDCICGQSGRFNSVMICSDLGWTGIPANLTIYFEALDFSNNQIELLQTDVFQGMQSLKRVELQYNSIQELPANIFKDAEQLEVVDLSFNNIETLPQELFKHNNRLKKFYVKRNPLSNPPDSAPLLSSRSLSVLDISFCGITVLWPHSFESLKNIKYLNIIGNNIAYLSVDIVKALQSLKQLEISVYDTDCRNASTREAVEYLREHSVNVTPPELCTGNGLHVKSIRIARQTTIAAADSEASGNEPVVPRVEEAKTMERNAGVTRSLVDWSQRNTELHGIMPTERNVGVRSVVDWRQRNTELRGIVTTEVVNATCVLLVVLVLMSAVVVLVRRAQQKDKKEKKRPPMPLPNRFDEERGPRSHTYKTQSGSFHEYAYPVLPGKEPQYCEVRGSPPCDDGYLPPRPTVSSVHQPLLRGPVYCPTTSPELDVFSNLRLGGMFLTKSYVRVPPRPSFCT